MADREILTAEFVRQILDYDPETGFFRWRHRNDASRKWNSKWAGKPAGYTRTDGYVAIKINEMAYKAHRLAWVHVNGTWPENDLDHDDLVRSNNRISNLRLCNMSQNKANMRKRTDNTSGLKGVSFRKDRQKWQAQAGLVYLGQFDCPAAAHFAYIVAADREYGEFSRSS